MKMAKSNEPIYADLHIGSVVSYDGRHPRIVIDMNT